MKRASSAVIILGLLALIVVYLATYTVHETERAIKFRLGEIIETDIRPGLHFKVPIVNNVRTFDARVQTLDEQPQRFLTVEKKNVIVDAFVKWRIGEVERYYVTVGGDPARANLRLSEIIRNGLRNEFGKRTIREVVSGDRSQIMDILRGQAADAAGSLGLNIVDVRIQRIDLPEDVSESVFQRMTAERERVAREFRAEGREAAERIRAEADRQREVIIAEARRDAEILRGEGDALATEIYAKAYGEDGEFYSFYRSLGAYERAFRTKEDMLLLSPDSEFFRHFERIDQSEPQ